VFVNRKTSSEIIKIKQEIFIEAIRKEAIVNFEIVMDSEYAPIIV
jgi:hypothetical protein